MLQLVGDTIDEPVIVLAARASCRWTSCRPAGSVRWKPSSPPAPRRQPASASAVPPVHRAQRAGARRSKRRSPRVFIPVFPGTNCEYDTARAFEKAGAEPQVLVVNNLIPAGIEETIEPHGNGDPAMPRSSCCPAASPAATSRTARASSSPPPSAIPGWPRRCTELLQKRDGLMLGICNGFQALIKLGLVPYGEIREP